MKRIKERLTALEQGSTSEHQRITCIELVGAGTGEAVGVIHIGGQPDQAGVMAALEYKHKARPPPAQTDTTGTGQRPRGG